MLDEVVGSWALSHRRVIPATQEAESDIQNLQGLQVQVQDHPGQFRWTLLQSELWTEDAVQW